MNEEDPDGRDGTDREMAPPEKANLYRHYSWVMQMRQTIRPTAVTIRVNDEARMTWQLSSSRTCALALSEHDRVLEIWSDDACIPLAVAHLGSDSDTRTLELGGLGRLILREKDGHVHLAFKPSLVWRWARLWAPPNRGILSMATALSICLVLGFLVGRGLEFDVDTDAPRLRSRGPAERGEDRELDRYDRVAARALFERGEYLFGSQPERAAEALGTLELAYSLAATDPVLTREILERIIFIADGLDEDEKVAYYEKRLDKLQRPPP